MTGLFSESFLKKYWRYKTPIDFGENSYTITYGIFYKPIQAIIDACISIYELRLPRYNLNDTFPLDENGYTKVTHSLLLERGRYYADGPLLFENINDIKFIAKGNYTLVLHITLHILKGHDTGITVKNCNNLTIEHVHIVGHWKL